MRSASSRTPVSMMTGIADSSRNCGPASSVLTANAVKDYQSIACSARVADISLRRGHLSASSFCVRYSCSKSRICGRHRRLECAADSLRHAGSPRPDTITLDLYANPSRFKRGEARHDRFSSIMPSSPGSWLRALTRIPKIDIVSTAARLDSCVKKHDGRDIADSDRCSVLGLRADFARQRHATFVIPHACVG